MASSITAKVSPPIPSSLQRPWAGSSCPPASPRRGAISAAQACDVLFTNLTELDQASHLVADIRAAAAAQGTGSGCLHDVAAIVCRPTQREAEDFYYFAEEMATREALDYYKQQKGLSSRTHPRYYVDRPLMTRFSRAFGTERLRFLSGGLSDRRHARRSRRRNDPHGRCRIWPGASIASFSSTSMKCLSSSGNRCCPDCSAPGCGRDSTTHESPAGLRASGAAFLLWRAAEHRSRGHARPQGIAGPCSRGSHADGFEPVGDRRDFRIAADPGFLSNTRRNNSPPRRTMASPPYLAAEMAVLSFKANWQSSAFRSWWFGVPAILKGWFDLGVLAMSFRLWRRTLVRDRVRCYGTPRAAGNRLPERRANVTLKARFSATSNMFCTRSISNPEPGGNGKSIALVHRLAPARRSADERVALLRVL